MPATKEFREFSQQIQILEGRQLKFKNKARALNTIKKYNYFDVINGFETLLLKKGTATKEYGNVYFEDFFDLYKFDIKLGACTLCRILDVETRLRTALSYHFARIHCNTKATTMNYIDPAHYIAPPANSTDLANKFKHLVIFKKAEFDKNGRKTKSSFIEDQKKFSEYMNSYIEPPFWVTVKTLPLGTLYYTFLFCDTQVKDAVLQEFGFSMAQIDIFTQALHAIKEIRNSCAHMELVTRKRLDKRSSPGQYSDIINFKGLSQMTHLNYMDVTKILKMYGSVNRIKMRILHFYFVMSIKGRRKIAKKILGKMGNQRISQWMRI